MYTPLENLEEWKADALKALRQTLDRRSFMRQGLTALTGAAMYGTLLKCFAGTHVLADEPDVPKSAVKTGTFFFPRLKFDVLNAHSGWNVYPIADVILRRTLTKLTNINVSEEPVVVSLADMKSLVRYPFIFATDERRFRFPKNEEANLREFLLRGGFVYGDDCIHGRNKILFFEDYRRMMNRIWPDNPMRRVPDSHEIYHCYFDFPKGLPYLQGQDIGGWGTFDKQSGRLLTYVTPTDLHCGWTCRFFTPKLNEASIKMGINIIIYYLSH